MANRAYLYSDGNELVRWYEWEQNMRPYYDSRHNIPLSWYFFFQSRDLKMRDVVYEDSAWQEVIVSAPMDEAVQTFRDRISLLLQITGLRFDAENLVNRLLNDVASWNGEFLLMDPWDVFNGHWETDEENFVNCLRILEALEHPNRTAESVAGVMRYTRTTFKSQDELELNLIGYTYRV